MSEAATSQQLATQTEAPARAVREYRVVENALGIMDTARFEHLGRVATVMARAGLMPQSLTHFKKPGASDTAALEEHSWEVVQARAFLIANQADLFGMDPNALAQCVSIVHGKLMYEGKLVHALISAKLGVDLDYQFGRYDAAKRDILGSYDPEGDWIGEMPSTVDDQGLGVRVVGTLPGERKPRWIAGSVAMWHKGPKSPWGAVTAWPRQLRYMGAREWCRAYKPSLLLGIMTDDEVDEYDLGRQVGAIAPATPQMLHAGFSDQRTAQLLPPEPPARRTRGKAAPKPEPELPPHNPDTGEVLNEALKGDDLPADLKSEPHAPPGAVYLLEGDEVDHRGFLRTYKDGAHFSNVDQDGVSRFAMYPKHAPEVARPTETAPAQSAESKPASSASATPASGASAAATSSPAATETKSDAGEPVEEGEFEDAPAPLHPDVQAYAEAVKGAPDFQTVKSALATLQKTDTWKAMSNDEADEVRFNTWDIMVETGVAAKAEPAADVSAFRLWLEWQEDPEMIEGMLSKLEDHPEFAQKTDTLKENIRGATKKRLERLAPV